MIAGFDRYYQIATLLPGRGPARRPAFRSSRQLDVEMAFPDREYLFALMERMMRADLARVRSASSSSTPFPRMTYDEAMLRYGSDKPDLRFGLEIEDATEVTRGSEFGVFANAPAVRFLRVPQEFSRAELDRLEEFAKEWGAKGLAYLVFDEDGRGALADREVPLRGRAGGVPVRARRRPCSSAPTSRRMVARVLGALRLHLGRELELIDDDAWRFLWVTDFPLFEWDEDDGALDGRAPPVHAADRRDGERLLDTDPGAARAVAYDLVGNGDRARRRLVPDPRARAAGAGLRPRSRSRRRSSAQKFGFLLDALAMGAPPHGGIALGHRPALDGAAATSRTSATRSRSRRTRPGSTR